MPLALMSRGKPNARASAVSDGKSVAHHDFTAVDGLMMGTWTGVLDPGMPLYLLDRHGMDARALEDLRSADRGFSGCRA